MEVQTDFESDTLLFNRLIPFVWLIEIFGKYTDSKIEKPLELLSGFGVHKSNLIVTYSGSICLDGFCIRAKRVTGNDDFKDCTIVKNWARLHLAVLLVENVAADDNVLEFGVGNLEVGERVFHIGHPLGFEASFLSGEVVFRCRPIDYKFTKETCDHYENSIADQQFSDYRIMGSYFNVRWFKNSMNQGVGVAYNKLKSLHSRIPIVQLNGMMVKSGCYGGPLFNSRGQVVGIMFGGIIGYPIAIHVSVLNKVEITVKKLLEKQESEKAEKKRDLPEDRDTSKGTIPMVKEGRSVSKKTKA
ncbi:hypothetical protein RND81_04G066100 [Saponaria officinalis]|uniref:Uncharacterized protein n=1 Tax=Saponaria officinalis TaxID=3572 RepID=A0AAW1LK47_SAPOF